MSSAVSSSATSLFSASFTSRVWAALGFAPSTARRRRMRRWGLEDLEPRRVLVIGLDGIALSLPGLLSINVPLNSDNTTTGTVSVGSSPSSGSTGISTGLLPGLPVLGGQGLPVDATLPLLGSINDLPLPGVTGPASISLTSPTGDGAFLSLGSSQAPTSTGGSSPGTISIGPLFGGSNTGSTGSGGTATGGGSGGSRTSPSILLPEQRDLAGGFESEQPSPRAGSRTGLTSAGPVPRGFSPGADSDLPAPLVLNFRGGGQVANFLGRGVAAGDSDVSGVAPPVDEFYSSEESLGIVPDVAPELKTAETNDPAHGTGMPKHNPLPVSQPTSPVGSEAEGAAAEPPPLQHPGWSLADPLVLLLAGAAFTAGWLRLRGVKSIQDKLFASRTWVAKTLFGR